jgi:hypothetical protein
MTNDPSPVADAPRGFLSPSPTGHPGSHCIRCGRPTPAGVALCDDDNPGGIKGPSATQVHGTILAGVVLGGLVFLALARLAIGVGGPYVTDISGRASLAGGGVELVFAVTNSGHDRGIANCRVTRDGSPRPDDYQFRTEFIDPGATIQLTKQLPAPSGGAAGYDLPRATVACT